LFRSLPFSTSSSGSEKVTHLRAEVVRLKRELAAVSAQDEFSRWAKIRRQHDKAVEEHDKIAEKVKTSRTSFEAITKVMRWILTVGLRNVLQLYYIKQPMFWIPSGWLPGYAEWLLSFPRAPRGSVSIQIWWGACAMMITLVGEALGAIWMLVGQWRTDGNIQAENKEKRKDGKIGMVTS